MLNRRGFGGALAAGAIFPARETRRAPAPEPRPPNETNLARILRTKKLRVAGFAGEEPFFAKEPTTKQWVGFGNDMARDLATELGVGLEIVESSTGDSLTDLQAGRIDLSYGPNLTVKRALLVDFSTTLFDNTFVIIARKGFAPKSWAELNVPDSQIAVDSGSAREEISRRVANNATIIGFKTRDEATLAVQSGRADCLVATVLFALAAVKKNPQLGDVIIPVPSLRAPACAALPYDGDRRFRDVVNAWCDDNRANGQIREWILAALSRIGIQPSDLPPEVSF